MNLLKYLLLLAGFFLIFSEVQAQVVQQDSVPEAQGPNRKHFSQFYVGLGGIFGPADGIEIKTLRSPEQNFGYRYKRRFTQWYSVGFDLAYNQQSFGIEQKSGKFVPDTLLHKKEQITFHHVLAGVYQRFNFGKRGNQMGTYIDLGAYGTFAFDALHKFKDQSGSVNNAGAKKTKVKNKDLQYIEKLNYGLTARFGINRFVMYGSYRLSEIFKENSFSKPAELPRYTAGVQLNFY